MRTTCTTCLKSLVFTEQKKPTYPFYQSANLPYLSQKACRCCKNSGLRKQKSSLEELSFFFNMLLRYKYSTPFFSRKWGPTLWNEDFREVIFIRRKKRKWKKGFLETKQIKKILKIFNPNSEKFKLSGQLTWTYSTCQKHNLDPTF